MRSISRYLLLTLLAILALPAVASAHEFQTSNGLFFNANTNLYRQKTIERPWQLVALPQDSAIKQSVSFDGLIWLVVEIDSKQYLYRQDRPLNFTAVDNFAEAEEIVLKLTDSNLVAFRQTGGQVGLTVFRAGNQSAPVVPPLVGSENDLARIAEFDGKLLYLQQSGATVSVFQQKPPGWELTAQVACDESRLIEKPILGLYCRDGTVLRAETIERWVGLNLPPIRDIYSSGEILAGWDKVNNNLFHIWRSSSATSPIVLPLSSAEVSQVIISGSRVLLKKTGSNWYELSWQVTPPQIIELTKTSSGSVIPVVDANGLLINGTASQVSTVVGEWRIITTVGSFLSARQTPLGLLIWNFGSLTQFAPTGSTVFTKVNPWSSTTSPIQAVEIGQTTSFISVINSSSNVNLYKTTDFTHWNRLTLPTKPTFSPTVSQARELAAGTLVELAGVITVGPKIVDDEAIYLEDATAGIQLFLSKTSGLLPTKIKINAVATGAISASQTKRILLNTSADLEQGSASAWIEPIITPDQAVNYQGRSVQLKGDVTDVETDYLLLGSLKLHFADAKNFFRADDQAQWPSVVDWNSSSGKVESWATSSNYQLLFRVAPATSLPPTKVETTTSKKTTATSKKSATVSVATDQSTQISSSIQAKTEPVLVSSANKNNNDSQTVSMSIVSLITGLLSFRGRRFRRFLPD